MADTRRLAMLKAVESTLDGVGKPTGLTVTRYAFRALEKGDLPALVIAHGGGLRVGDEVNELYEHTDLVRIAAVCLGNQSAPPDDAIDAHLSWIDSALRADETLGGAVSRLDFRPTGETEVVEGDFVYVRVIQDVEITYYRTRTDPESQT